MTPVLLALVPVLEQLIGVVIAALNDANKPAAPVDATPLPDLAAVDAARADALIRLRAAAAKLHAAATPTP